ncbi:MAG: GC-type dockerin domain-anchored protein [Planctomycetota bacterium]
MSSKCLFLLPVVLAFAPAVVAQEATFDGFDAGFLGREFTDGGITFSENLWFPGGGMVRFAATAGGGTLGGDPFFSAPNVMTTGGWSTGSVLGFTRTHQWIATTGEPVNAARVDVWYNAGTSWAGTEVSLEGILDGEVVVSDTFIHPGSGAPFAHARLEIAGRTFTEMRFICRGGTVAGELDGILAVFDNVAMFDDFACPADIDGDGELTLFDFLAFQNLFDAGDPAADFDGDGSLTLFDFLAFQNAFDAGCA